MRPIILTLLCAASPLLAAKEVHIRANIIQQCATQWAVQANDQPQTFMPTTVVELQVDCLDKVTWAKLSKTDEQLWQRISIEY